MRWSRPVARVRSAKTLKRFCENSHKILRECRSEQDSVNPKPNPKQNATTGGDLSEETSRTCNRPNCCAPALRGPGGRADLSDSGRPQLRHVDVLADRWYIRDRCGGELSTQSAVGRATRLPLRPWRWGDSVHLRRALSPTSSRSGVGHVCHYPIRESVTWDKLPHGGRRSR